MYVTLLTPNLVCWADARFQSMNQVITKNSPTLNREADYSAKLRLSRVPANLAVLMVRFAWKRDINKKAKIMVGNAGTHSSCYKVLSNVDPDSSI